MKFNSALFSTLLTAIALQTVVSVQAQTTDKVEAERWFEVEVILFKQLNNKAALKEQFPEGVASTNLPSYRQAFDILTPYLQPSLTRIKQFAPLCGEQDEQHQFLASLQSFNIPSSKQLQLLEQIPSFTMPDFPRIEEVNLIDEVISPSVSEVSSEYDANTSAETVDKSTQVSGLIIEEVNSNIHFSYDLQEETLAKAIFDSQIICIISQTEIEAILSKDQLADFNIDAFPVKNIPKKLNPAGVHVSDSPYLIADDSLLLKDISKRLGWSKEFRPLLHLGWRQVGITKNKAVPVKLHAGKNLENSYQEALTEYQLAVIEAEAIEQKLLEELQQSAVLEHSEYNAIEQPLSSSVLSQETIETENKTELLPLDSEQLIKVKQKQQALRFLFDDINQFNDEAFLATIDKDNKQTLAHVLTGNKLTTDISDVMENQASTPYLLDMNNPPLPPLQQWFIDGFFKVHLDHYLFINVDFNVYNQNQVNISTKDDDSSKIKLVNFSQNRRVITGEIHYFDHPHLGMIVQIRRFDPSKPADEAVTQAIK